MALQVLYAVRRRRLRWRALWAVTQDSPLSHPYLEGDMQKGGIRKSTLTTGPGRPSKG